MLEAAVRALCKNFKCHAHPLRSIPGCPICSGTQQSKRSSIFGGARWGTNKAAVPLRAAPSLLPAQGEAAAETAIEPELQPEPEAPRPDDGPLLPDEDLVDIMQAGAFVLCPHI